MQGNRLYQLVIVKQRGQGQGILVRLVESLTLDT